MPVGSRCQKTNVQASVGIREIYIYKNLIKSASSKVRWNEHWSRRRESGLGGPDLLSEIGKSISSWISPCTTDIKQKGKVHLLTDFSFLYNFMYLSIFGCNESSLLCIGFSLVAVKGGCSLVAMCRLLFVVASHVAEHGLQSTRVQ